MLTWESELLLRDVNFRKMIAAHKLWELITAAGKMSIQFLVISRRIPHTRVGQLTPREFQSWERFLKYPELGRIGRQLLNMPIGIRDAQGSLENNEIFPIKIRQLVHISSLSSKELRLNGVNEEDQIISIYKLGPKLTPGEVLSWTGKIKKLTSTRHNNILIRVAHVDIFSNARLMRFGLRQESNCPNCPEPNESIKHKIIDCKRSQDRARWG